MHSIVWIGNILWPQQLVVQGAAIWPTIIAQLYSFSKNVFLYNMKKLTMQGYLHVYVYVYITYILHVWYV